MDDLRKPDDVFRGRWIIVEKLGQGAYGQINRARGSRGCFQTRLSSYKLKGNGEYENSHASLSFDMDMYIRLFWINRRFSHNYSQPVLFTDEDVGKFWLPDIYFSNAKVAKYQDVLTPNKFLRIYRNGEIHLSTRVTLKLSCSQNLRRYPMDTQKCGPIIRSLVLRIPSQSGSGHEFRLSDSHTTRKMALRWSERKPIRGLEHTELPELFIINSSAEVCDDEFSFAETDSYHMKGNFSCLYGEIVLQRQVSYHIVQTYLPTGMIVIISWVSFFIEPSAIPARVSLSFTTLLTLSTMAAGVRSSLPPVAYAKAIDVWIGVCMFFVFACLLQFAIVNSYTRSANSIAEIRSTGRPHVHRMMSKLIVADTDREILQEKLEAIQIQKKLHAKKIDRACRIIFPGTFLAFNMVYWPFYTGWNDFEGYPRNY